eukprot:scpid108162/ scgid32946/ 
MEAATFLCRLSHGTFLGAMCPKIDVCGQDVSDFEQLSIADSGMLIHISNGKTQMFSYFNRELRNELTTFIMTYGSKMSVSQYVRLVLRINNNQFIRDDSGKIFTSLAVRLRVHAKRRINVNIKLEIDDAADSPNSVTDVILLA